MTRSELLQIGINLSTAGMQEPNETNFFHGNANEDMRALNALGLELFLAEQKRSEGCPVCRGEEIAKDYFGHSCVKIQGNHMEVANADGEYPWNAVEIKACPFCTRDLTEGDSV